MKLLYTIKEKGKLMLVLSLFLAIEIFNSSSQTENIEQLDTTINEIYSDRLVAQDLIYKMSGIVHEQKDAMLATNNQDSVTRSAAQRFNVIADFLCVYDKTRLTKKEAVVLGELKQKMNKLTGPASLKKDLLLPEQKKEEYIAQLDAVFGNLNQLSEIQVSRSKDLKQDSHKITLFSGVVNRLNWAVLFITALVISAILLSAKSIVPRFPQQEQWN